MALFYTDSLTKSSFLGIARLTNLLGLELCPRYKPFDEAWMVEFFAIRRQLPVKARLYVNQYNVSQSPVLLEAARLADAYYN